MLFNYLLFPFKLHSYSTQLDCCCIFSLTTANINPLTRSSYVNILDDDDDGDDGSISDPRY